MTKNYLLPIALFSALAATCQAQIDDPLHGACISATCSDNGTVTPVNQNPMPTFTFTASPGPQTGNFFVEILIPNDAANAGALNFSVDATDAGPTDSSTISAASTLKGDWTSGDLAAFLGISASPANPLSAFLGNTNANGDPGATGFDVYQVDLGSNELQPNNNAIAPILTLSGSSLPIASTITAFLNTGAKKGEVATASSGQLFEADAPVPSVPEPASLLLLGSAAVLVLARGRKTRKTAHI